MKYADVILPLKLPWCPVYAVEDRVCSGDRVLVKLAGKEYVGVVWHTDVVPSLGAERVKPVTEADTGLTPISDRDLEFWEFIAGYYMCSIGEVYKSAYPASRIKSEKTSLASKARAEASTKKQLKSLENRVKVLEERLKNKSNALEARILKEQTGGRVSRQSGIKMRLETEKAKAQENLTNAIKALEDFRSSPMMGEAQDTGKAQGTENVQDTGNAKGQRNVKGLGNAKGSGSAEGPRKAQVIVSSDRTSFYLTAIKKTLTEGRQVLVLAPEKAFLGRIRNSLSEGLYPKGGGKDESVQILDYSSDSTPVTRRKVSVRVRTEQSIVLGTRSALFLPFKDLGLIIIDEEQDTFYKQTEPNPRYHGRDAAMALAKIHGSEVILGTESPSLETLNNCLSGKYSLTKETVRLQAVTIDVNAERRKNGMIGPVSRKLIQAIHETQGASVIVRGWEKPEELDFGKLCPGKDVRVMSMQELKSEGAGDATLIGVLQADAFVGKDDFRADERACQLAAQLSSMAQDVVIQTSAPDRFTGERGADALLAERKTFKYPPYTRLVDITVEDTSEKRLSFICGKISEKLKVAGLPISPGCVKFRLFLDRGSSLAERKKSVADTIEAIRKDYNYPGHIVIDVDPQ